MFTFTIKSTPYSNLILLKIPTYFQNLIKTLYESTKKIDHENSNIFLTPLRIQISTFPKVSRPLPS